MNFALTTEETSHNLTAEVTLIGEDILVALWGGDKPHIGAVAAAQPRPSLKEAEGFSASTSVICFVGHKEDELAKYLADKLASAFNKRVVVTAGAHWDDISEAGIEQVKRNTRKMAELLLQRIRSQS